MSKASIPSLAKEFLETYDAPRMDHIWKQQQEAFRSFWVSRVLDAASAPLSEDECDVIIRILDTSAKGHTKESEAVARVMDLGGLKCHASSEKNYTGQDKTEES